MLIQMIKEDSLDARKSGNKIVSGLLVTLLSEAQAVGKNADNREPTDAEVIAVVKKFIKNLDETIKVSGPGPMSKNLLERDILETYLPQQLTEDEIVTIISGLRAGEIMEPTMGNMMGYFKKMYEGRYDGALVAKHAKG